MLVSPPKGEKTNSDDWVAAHWVTLKEAWKVANGNLGSKCQNKLKNQHVLHHNLYCKAKSKIQDIWQDKVYAVSHLLNEEGSCIE